MLVSFTHKGSFSKVESFLTRMSTQDLYSKLGSYAQLGADALASRTPIDTGETFRSWSYKIEKKGRASLTISWTNSHLAGGTPLVLLLQYGHGTGTGGYVQGVDFINPAIKPIFDLIAEAVWKEVTR